MLRDSSNYRDFIGSNCGCRSVRPPCPTPPPAPNPCCCIGPQGPQGPAGPRGPIGPIGPQGPAGAAGPFRSSYMEALANTQVVGTNSNLRFDPDSIDNDGNNITLDQSGTIFVINRTGLYLVEWNMNLTEMTGDSAVFGIVENGEGASGASTSTLGSFSSGTIINVDTVPFTLTLHNYNGTVTLGRDTDPENSAASIRIVRFADGASV